MAFTVIIPARYASSRLPGKPLIEIKGKTLIQHVHECAQRTGAERIVVATDDARIQRVAESFGAEVCMTSVQHISGTDRVAEVVEKLGCSDDEIIVNLQGDEPLIPPSLLRQVAQNLRYYAQASMATLCEPINTAADLFNPNINKVVMDKEGYALYFSRAPIPWDRTAFLVSTDELPQHSRHYRHIGLYAYRVSFLREYVHWPVCDLEQIESLEQLRVLWQGRKIHVSQAMETAGPGVDTEADIGRVEMLLSDAQRYTQGGVNISSLLTDLRK